MAFKADIVDIDGTIIDCDRSIDCKAVTALRSQHISVVIATGNVLSLHLQSQNSWEQVTP